MRKAIGVIGITLVAAIAVIVGASVHASRLSSAAGTTAKPLSRGIVEGRAIDWCHRMEMPDCKADCQTIDSDGDGYTSCTILYKGELFGIECGSITSIFNTSCRLPKTVVRR